MTWCSDPRILEIPHWGPVLFSLETEGMEIFFSVNKINTGFPGLSLLHFSMI